jgi:hypothetical protein
MKHSDFRIGQDFWCDAHHWRCTDIGTRTMPFVLIVLTWQEFQMVAFKVWDMMPLQKRVGLPGPLMPFRSTSLLRRLLAIA